jgi:hypothetical protein
LRVKILVKRSAHCAINCYLAHLRNLASYLVRALSNSLSRRCHSRAFRLFKNVSAARTVFDSTDQPNNVCTALSMSTYRRTIRIESSPASFPLYRSILQAVPESVTNRVSHQRQPWKRMELLTDGVSGFRNSRLTKLKIQVLTEGV